MESMAKSNEEDAVQEESGEMVAPTHSDTIHRDDRSERVPEFAIGHESLRDSNDSPPKDGSFSLSASMLPVGPGNFEKIRILGMGATGRVYLVRSVVRP